MGNLLIRWLTIVLMLVFFDISLIVYSQMTTLQKNQEFFTSSWSYLQTREKLSLDNITEKFRLNQFKPIKQAVLNAGVADQYYWIHFVVGNRGKTRQSMIINIENARLNELELFEMADQSAHSLGKLGDFRSFSERSVWHKNFLYQVSVNPGKDNEYFLFVNQVGHTFTLPVSILPARNFTTSAFRDYLFNGLTYGMLLFVGIMTFLFFLTSRHALYLYYALYIFTATLWFLSYFGLGYQYLWVNNPALNTSMPPIMAAVNILLNLQICQILLKLEKRNRILDNMTNITKWSLGAVASFPVVENLNQSGYVVNHTYLIIFLATILTAMVVLLLSIFMYVIKGIFTAKIYFTASLLKACSIINLALLELGVLPAMANMEGVMQIGIFVEITLLTYGLAKRYTFFKLKTVEQVIEAQENERLLISQEIHDGILSSLTGVNLGLKNLTRDIDHLPTEKKILLEKIFNELNKVQVEARNISHNTMPEYISNSLISDIVEKHIEEVQTRLSNASVTKNFLQLNFSSNEQVVKFSHAVKLNIFRIMQELITNIVKHSNATKADLLFSFSNAELTIIAEDNGVGIHPPNIAKPKGLGLQSIRSRVALLDGDIHIDSPIYKRDYASAGTSDDSPVHPSEYGTMIRIQIPFRQDSLINRNEHDY